MSARRGAPWYVPHRMAPQLTKIGLQLLPWPGLKPHRRFPALSQRLPPALNRLLHCPLADANAFLILQLLPHHLGVAVVLPELLPQPLVASIQLAGSVHRCVRLLLPQSQITAHCVAGDPQLPGNCPLTPATLQ